MAEGLSRDHPQGAVLTGFNGRAARGIVQQGQLAEPVFPLQLPLDLAVDEHQKDTALHNEELRPVVALKENVLFSLNGAEVHVERHIFTT